MPPVFNEYGYEVITPSEGYPIMVYFHETEVSHVAAHWHRGLEIVNYPDCSCVLIYNGIRVDLPADALIVVNSGHIHSLNPNGTRDRGVSLIFPADFLLQYGIDTDRILFHFTAGEENDAELRRMLHSFSSLYANRERDPFYSLRCNSMIFSILHHLMTHYQDRNTGKTAVLRHEKLCQDIILYIARHYPEDLTLERVSREFRLSEGYICRLFRSHLGYSFKEHLTDVRLQTAVTQILNTNKTLLAIALDCGFPDYRAFVRCFQKAYGVKPKEYRNRPTKFLPRFSE